MTRPEITDAMVEAAALALHDATFRTNDWTWDMYPEGRKPWIGEAREALNAAFSLIPAEPLGFCRKTQGCRLTDGHEGTCPR